MLEDKIKALNRMYRHLDRHVSAFKRRSGISCVHECGLCCMTGELNATASEFLPAAYNLYLNGESELILDRIARKQDTICVFYNPDYNGGHCRHFTNRGLICRLFGFSVNTNKYGVPGLVTCQAIKDAMDYPPAPGVLEAAPSLSSYYMRLYGIDPASSTNYLPVNQAISEAIEQVSLHFSFRKRPEGYFESQGKDEMIESDLWPL